MAKKVVKFRIKDLHSDHAYISVRIFGTRKEMLRFIKKHSNEDHSDTGAAFLPRPAWRDRWDGSGVMSRREGYLVMNRKFKQPQVVVHELVHAAGSLYRRRFDNTLCLGPMITEREEEFAHFLDQLWAQMNKKLRKHGVWPKG